MGMDDVGVFQPGMDPPAKPPDYVSADPPAAPASSSCPTSIPIDVPPAQTPVLSWPLHGSGGALVSEVVAGDGSELLIADQAFGLRVVTRDESGSFHAGPALTLDARAIDLHRLEDRRVLVVTEGEVLLVALPPAGQRDAELEVKARLALDGYPRASQLRAGADGPALHVVLDHGGQGICELLGAPPRGKTSLATIAIGADELLERASLDLDVQAQAVRFQDDAALIAVPDGESPERAAHVLGPSALLWFSLDGLVPVLRSRTALGGANRLR